MIRPSELSDPNDAIDRGALARIEGALRSALVAINLGASHEAIADAVMRALDELGRTQP